MNFDVQLCTILINDNFVQRKVKYYKVSRKIIMRIFTLSAAYLKVHLAL